MYYTGINPLDGKEVYVARDYHEKQLQRALLQYNRPQNYDLVVEALQKCGRTDLIGNGPDCLIRPRGSAPHGDAHRDGKPTRGSRQTRSAAGDRARSDSRRSPAKQGKAQKPAARTGGDRGRTSRTHKNKKK